MENLKLSKLIKKGIRNYIRNHHYCLIEKISIELHFDLFHGYKLLSDSIELINKEDKSDFKNYIKNENSFHQFQMYILKKLLNHSISKYLNGFLNVKKI